MYVHQRESAVICQEVMKPKRAAGCCHVTETETVTQRGQAWRAAIFITCQP